MQLLNPFSIRLEKPAFQNIDERNRVFTLGNFRVYKKCNEWFLHTFKNIIVAERCAINKTLLSNIKGDSIPSTDEAKKYHDYERPLQAMKEGIQAAKKLNFKIQ